MILTRQVFISYSHSDASWVEDFLDNLTDNGALESINFWIDRDGIQPAENWQDSIDRAIRNSSVMLVVCSQTANESYYVTYEWSFALGCKIPVIPIIRDDTNLHSALRGIQGISFKNRNPIQRVREELQKLAVPSKQRVLPPKTGEEPATGERWNADEVSVFHPFVKNNVALLQNLFSGQNLTFEGYIDSLFVNQLISAEDYSALREACRKYRARERQKAKQTQTEADTPKTRAKVQPSSAQRTSRRASRSRTTTRKDSKTKK